RAIAGGRAPAGDDPRLVLDPRACVPRRPAGAQRLEIFAFSWARRSWNAGWRIDHTCGSSSRSTAAAWVSTSAMSWIVCLILVTSSGGPDAAAAAIALAVGRS